MSLAEAAARLGLPESRVYSLMACGVLPTIKVGDEKQIHKDKFESYCRRMGV